MPRMEFVATSVIAWMLVAVGASICMAADATPTARDAKDAPPALALIGPKPKPVPRPDPKEIDAAIGRGVAFLLKTQNANGSWGSERSSRPDEIYAPVPGAHESFRGAVTSLCVSALCEVGAGAKVGRASSTAQPSIERSIAARPF